MQKAYGIARNTAHKSAQRNKRFCDSKVRSSLLHPGDRVLVRNMTPRGGTGKLRNHWEDTIHVVVRQVGENIPVYELRPEHGKGKSRVMHRNLLLPCDHLPLEADLHPRVKPKRKTALRDKVQTDSDVEEDEDEDDYYPSPPQPPTKQPQSGASVVVDNATEPQPNRSAPEPPGVEESDDDNQRSEDVPDMGPSDTEDEVSPCPVVDIQENRMETWSERPQRQRRPPKTFTYDKIGIPSCHSLARQPFYVSPQTWTRPIQPYYDQWLYLYGM